MIQTIINNSEETFQLPSGAVLLDVLRNNLKLKGTKEGCREGDCGSCIVLWGKLKNRTMKYRTVNSCMFPIGDAAHSHIVTIEGVNGKELNPIQQAIVDEGASQCGFCTPGFVMSMLGYFLQAKTLNIQDAISFLSGNICRCTGYASIIRAMERTLNLFEPKEFENSYPEKRISLLIQNKFLPEYFLTIPDRIKNIPLPSSEPALKSFVVAGGTDLYVQKGDEISDSNLFLLSSSEEYKGIYIENNNCVIRAATTISELEESELIQKLLPNFKKYIQLISCQSIRNRATVGGNIINASPIGDLSIILLALNSTVILKSNDATREVKLKDFFRGYKRLDKSPDELLYSVYFPLPSKNNSFHFEKVSRRMHLDIASVNSAIMLSVENNIVKEIHLSAGGVAPIPLYLSNAAAFLKNKNLNKENIDETVKIAMDEISPISDVRGSKGYKNKLLKILLYLNLTASNKSYD